jgi:hypothetical protein
MAIDTANKRRNVSRMMLSCVIGLAPSAGFGLDDRVNAARGYIGTIAVVPPVEDISQPYAIIGSNEISVESVTVLNGGAITDYDQTLLLEPAPVTYLATPSPSDPVFRPLRSFAKKDMTWQEDEPAEPTPFLKRNKILNFQTRPGTLLHEMWHQILRRLPVSNRNLFTTKIHTDKIYVRNINTFARHVDISCLSVWPDRPVTMITPLHGIAAAHFTPANGSIQRWVSMGNEWVERTVASSQLIFGDCQLVTLNSPLPDSIKPAKLVPFDFSDYIDPLYVDYYQYESVALDPNEWPYSQNYYPYLQSFFPTIRVNRFDNEILTPMPAGSAYYSPEGRWVNSRQHGNWFRHDNDTIGWGFPYWLPDSLEAYVYDSDNVRTGDSGHPMYFILDNEAVVVTTAFGGTSSTQIWQGPPLDAIANLIFNATGNTCQFADLSRFPKLNNLPLIGS